MDHRLLPARPFPRNPLAFISVHEWLNPNPARSEIAPHPQPNVRLYPPLQRQHPDFVAVRKERNHRTVLQLTCALTQRRDQ